MNECIKIINGQSGLKTMDVNAATIYMNRYRTLKICTPAIKLSPIKKNDNAPYCLHLRIMSEKLMTLFDQIDQMSYVTNRKNIDLPKLVYTK